MTDMTILEENEWPCSVKQGTSQHQYLYFLFNELKEKKKQVFASYFVNLLAAKMQELEEKASKT